MIPNRVRITSKVSYEIVYQDIIQNDPDCMGLCDPNKHIIFIQIGLSKKQLYKTFIHELTHAWNFEFELGISHESIYLLEDAILKTLTLNKWV